jgi:hypothetical protein
MKNLARKLEAFDQKIESWLYEKPSRTFAISALCAALMVGFVWFLKIITLFI